MPTGRQMINEDELENVVGGVFFFSEANMTLTYLHDDGTTTVYRIVDYYSAWENSNAWHGRNVPEDNIIKGLLKMGLIAE